MRLVFLMFLILPVLSSAAAVDTSAPAPAAPLAQPIEIRAEDLRTFVSVLRAVKDGYVDPADDTTLLDHLLRWPSLPRRAPAIAALLPPHGAHTVHTPHDDEAGGLIHWRLL